MANKLVFFKSTDFFVPIPLQNISRSALLEMDNFFGRLPPEVVEEILTYLSGDDVISVAAASEVLRQVVVAILVRNPNIMNASFLCKRQNTQGPILERN